MQARQSFTKPGTKPTEKPKTTTTSQKATTVQKPAATQKPRQSPIDIKKRMIEDLRDRQKKSQSMGIRPIGYFKKDIKITRFIPVDGDNFIDVIPYFAGDNEPLEEHRGRAVHGLDIYVHTDIKNSQGNSFVCLKRNYGLPCPACEWIDANADNLTNDQMIRYYAKRRQVFNVVDRTSVKGQSKGVQIFEVAHSYFGKFIEPLSSGPSRPGQEDNPETQILFARPTKEGRTIAFKVGKKKIKIHGKDAIVPDYTAHRFEPRDYDIEDNFLADAKILDSLIYIPTYDEMYMAVYGKRVEEVIEDVVDEPVADVVEDVVDEAPFDTGTTTTNETNTLDVDDLSNKSKEELLEIIKNEGIYKIGGVDLEWSDFESEYAEMDIEDLIYMISEHFNGSEAVEE